MARTTELVRTYATKDEFTLDEQALGQQGWSVQSTVRQKEQQGLMHRIRSFFSSPSAPAPIVVTYHRPNPS